MTGAAEPATQPAALRRFFSFTIDLILIAVPTLLVGIPIFNLLCDLGAYGHAIGATLVAVYFGYFESRHGGGQTPGKSWLGLEVIDVSESPDGLSFPRAALRGLITTAPLIIGGLTIANPLLSALQSPMTAGLSLAIAYLAIFNRPSRQTVQDLATRTLVICRNEEPAPGQRLAPVHRSVAAGLLLAAFAVPLALDVIYPDADDGEIAAVYARVDALPEVRNTAVKMTQAGKATTITVTAELRRPLVDKAATVKRLTAAIACGNEGVLLEGPVTLVLARRYHLGIMTNAVLEDVPLDIRNSRAGCRA